MSVKPQLVKDWQMLMQGMATIARNFPKFKVKVTQDSHIVINDDWNIICHFINNEYVEGVLSYKGEDVLKVRHLKSYSATTTAILEFIENNL